MVDMAAKRKATCAKDNAKIFATHFEHKIFNRIKESAFNLEILNETKIVQQVESLGKVPTLCKIITAIRNEKNGKASGENRVQSKAYTLWLEGSLVEFLQHIITQF